MPSPLPHGMKFFFFLFLLLLFGNCSPSETSNRHQLIFPDGSIELVFLDSISKVTYTELKRVRKNDTVTYDRYLLDGVPYTGYVRQIDLNSNHQYRYYIIEKGILRRQVGYYSNGQLDHDFQLELGQTNGHEKMWREDGSPYIEQYLEHGIPPGLQRRWHAGNVLAREALFEKGG